MTVNRPRAWRLHERGEGRDCCAPCRSRRDGDRGRDPCHGPDEIDAIKTVGRLALPVSLTCGASNRHGRRGCSIFETPYIHISFPVSRLLLELFEKDDGRSSPKQSGSSTSRRPPLRRSLARRSRRNARRRSSTPRRFRPPGGGLRRPSSATGRHRRDRSPSSVQRLFDRLLLRGTGPDLEFHGHDDLGMATANTLAAVEGGPQPAQRHRRRAWGTSGNAATRGGRAFLARALVLSPRRRSTSRSWKRCPGKVTEMLTQIHPRIEADRRP